MIYILIFDDIKSDYIFTNQFEMKKLFLSLFVVSAFSLTSSAQLNLKAGLTLANQVLDFGGISLAQNLKTGFLIGVNYEVPLAESTDLRPGIQFTLKGTNFEFGGMTVASNNFNYIEVPVDIVYNSGSLSFHGGPYLGLLMSAKADGRDVKDDTKSTEIGLNLGLGYSFDKIGFGANYGLGLSNINKEVSDGIIKNKAISFYVTYAL